MVVVPVVLVVSSFTRSENLIARFKIQFHALALLPMGPRAGLVGVEKRKICVHKRCFPMYNVYVGGKQRHFQASCAFSITFIMYCLHTGYVFTIPYNKCLCTVRGEKFGRKGCVFICLSFP
jgi:hypothetical protein